MKEKILIVEDEVELLEAIKTILNFRDYSVEVSYNGEEALEQVKNKTFDLIIMDIMMPVKTGIEALKEMRQIGINTPVILLTAKSQIDDKVEGLDAGANDYLTKPFDKKELLARIRAIIRTNTENKKIYNIGNLHFNKGSSELSGSKAVFRLNNKESEILEFLLKNQQRHVSSYELKRIIWPEESTSSSEISMYIAYLQNKLLALDSTIIINSKNGYKLENL